VEVADDDERKSERIRIYCGAAETAPVIALLLPIALLGLVLALGRFEDYMLTTRAPREPRAPRERGRQPRP
jgi:hypothetical protein